MAVFAVAFQAFQESFVVLLHLSCPCSGYDSLENLPQKTMLAREKGVFVAVVDIQSGTWKMAREIFEVLQKEITSKRKSVDEINVRIIQEVASDIGLLVKFASDIRGKTAKIQNLTEKIEEDL